MREEYDYLTDETKEVFEDNVKAVAVGWDKARSFIYGILGQDYKDPFAYFQAAYTGALKGGVSTAAWDHKLEYLRTKFGRFKQRGKRLSEVMADAFRDQNRLAEKWLETIADGEIDAAEIKQLQDLLDAGEPHREAIRQALAFARTQTETRPLAAVRPKGA